MSEAHPALAAPPAPLVRPAVAGAVAVVGAIICVAGALVRPDSFWPGYLIALVFWTGISLGCLAITLLHRMPGGRWGWGEGAGREFHACLAGMPLALTAAIPLIFGAPAIYPWARPDALAALNPHQRIYLAPMAVLIRLAAMLMIWSFLSVVLRSGYRKSAADGLPHPPARISGISLVIVWLTTSFAAIDVLMSVSPGWASSMFGALHGMGFVMSGMALAIIVRSRKAAGRPLTKAEIDVTQDLGSLLMAFDLMWAYFAFSEYLIIWSGDLPVEVFWFADRQRGWAMVGGLLLIVFHFAVPFALLLSRDLKRSPRALARVAGLLLVAHLCHLIWTIFPAIPQASGLSVVFTLVGCLGLGGLWLLLIDRAWERLPFVPAPLHEHAAIGEAQPRAGIPETGT